jgi:hypothetical protein
MPLPNRRHMAALIVAMAILVAAPLAVVASNAFTDVPDSNVHHDDITWLDDNNVTAGCNPPANDEFCPGDPVLRQQMASFMRRLAENQVVDAATAVEAETAADADALGGAPADAYHAYGDTLPAGESLSGAYAVNANAGYASQGITFSIPLPGDIPASDGQFIGDGQPFTAECPGIGEAAEGHLCVYESSSAGAHAFQCFCDPESGGSAIRSYGTSFFLDFTGAALGWSFGSWTVTSSDALTPLASDSGAGAPTSGPGSTG